MDWRKTKWINLHEQSEKYIKISWDQLNQNHPVLLPTQMTFQLSCIKEFKSPQKEIMQGPMRSFPKNVFHYELKSAKYPFTILP